MAHPAGGRLHAYPLVHPPKSRLLCLVLAIYEFAVFGYVTATIASFFIGLDKDKDTTS